MYRFLIVIEKAENNYSAYAPDLPGCVATGKTREEAERNMHEAIALHVHGMHSPDSGNADMQGASTFRRDSANREEDADGAREGSRTGSASGESPSMALTGKATQRLEAQLKLEAIQRRDEKGGDDDKDGKGWIYTGSQQQASSLDFEDVRARGGFDREAAAQHDRIPVRQKQVVKNYFLNLHESEKK